MRFHRSLSQAAQQAEPNNLKRTVPRQPVDWKAKYRFQDEPEGYWRTCRLSDISPMGLGLRMFGVTPEDVHNERLEVIIQLSGDVRNAVAGMDNDVRVGIELVELATDAAKFVDSLKRSDARW